MAQRMGGECPRCGRANPEADQVLCPDCRAALMSAEGALRIRVSPIIKQALVSAQPGEDFDESLLRALKAHHSQHASALLGALTHLIALEAQRGGKTKEQTVRRLADEQPGPEITFTESGTDSPVVRTITERKVITIGDKEYQSMDDLPPHLRRIAGAGMPRRESPRVGCSVGTAAWLLSLLVRR